MTALPVIKNLFLPMLYKLNWEKAQLSMPCRLRREKVTPPNTNFGH